MEQELKAAKRFNKAAVAIILIMLVMMSFMMVNMHRLAAKYERLEGNYGKLYEEMNVKDTE